MYSGTTLTKFSGRMLGAHQKIDRVARRHLSQLLPESASFPPIRTILHFEGKNGPDAIKRKSPAQDEPWHYFDPFDANDNQLLQLIDDHYKKLVKELRSNNMERSSFEAAWLAHAIVDGLTPAHHFPYEERLAELRGGEGIETRTSIKTKLVMPGDTKREQLKNNWKMWGSKGLLLTHGLFEFGVATLIKPLTFSDSVPNKAQVANAKKLGPRELFRDAAKEIASKDMYNRYYEKGWTPRLAYEVRHQLGPIIIQTVTLIWLLASVDAGQRPLSKKKT